MINVYSNLKDERGNLINGRTKLFVHQTDEEGNILNCLNGTSFTPAETGNMFIVDEWLINQLDKLLVIDGELIVKDGETIEAPKKSEVDLQEEELLKQLAELRAKKSESAE